MNFPQRESWTETLQQLDASQAQLIAAFETFPPGKLHEQVPGSKEAFTFYSILHGIIHHDLYHAGQIMLIKKTFSQQSI
jgi:hypothetical protein